MENAKLSEQVSNLLGAANEMRLEDKISEDRIDLPYSVWFEEGE